MKKIFIILAAAAALFTMASCDKFEDGRPPSEAIKTFESMYPNARFVEWDYEGAYWEVDFRTGGVEYSARYDLTGSWISTKREMFYSAVPQAIKDAFAAKYPTATLEDNTVDYYQTPTGEFYRFDVFLNGVKTEVDVTLDGKTSAVPSRAAEQGFNQNAPEADVWDVEWDFEGTHWEVSFETGTRPHGTEYTMYFDLDGNWLATSTEIFLKDIPQNIIDAFKASEYGNAFLDDDEVEFFKTPSAEFYRFEIEVNGRDAMIDIDINGNVTFVGYDN